MKVLKILLITVLALGMSTGYAQTYAEDYRKQDLLIKAVLASMASMSDNELKEFREDILVGFDEYCTTRDLQPYKTAVLSNVEEYDEEQHMSEPYRRKLTGVSIGSIGGITTASTFLLNGLSKRPRIGIGVAGVLVGLYGAAIYLIVDSTKKYFGDHPDTELDSEFLDSEFLDYQFKNDLDKACMEKASLQGKLKENLR